METPKERICSICKEKKEIEKFTKDKSESSGYSYSCKECRKIKDTLWRNNNRDKIKKRNDENIDKRKNFYQGEEGIKSSRRTHLKMKYGITLEEYDKMYDEQNKVCAICGGNESCSRNKFLAVDHCHKKNKLRGLLCSNCNRALGLFKDDIEILKKATNYLTKHKI